jgi:predicted RNA-binding Zn ribbon-like protein
VYVRSGHDTEIRLTLEAMVDLLNALDDADGPTGGGQAASDTVRADVRALLHDHAFTRAAGAPAAAVERVEARTRVMAPALRRLADGDAADTIEWINRELATIPITPSLTEHDGADLHIHWTPTAATFDDQVVADILMALAQEVCDHGTDRFGRCAASDCEHLFFDATRNGSRRFCADPRCASRTHTADHRARRRSG